MTSHSRPSGPLPAIEARKLTKTFGSLCAVRDLDLEVHPGEIFGLVGPDGAGKTTSLRMLSTIMNPSSGTGWIAGYDIDRDATLAKTKLAYMSQRFALYPDLTVQENISFYSDLYGVPIRGRQERINELLDFSHMRPFARRQAGKLSGGMKQKLQLICALVHTPAVLLLDEPTNGVDPVSRRDFWRVLHRLLEQRVAILITTAYLDEAERCDRIALLNQGSIMVSGPPDQVKQMVHGHIIAIRSSQSRAVAGLLRPLDTVRSADVFGDTVHLLCDSPEETMQTSSQTLQQAGISWLHMKETAPSLEDVFISTLGAAAQTLNRQPSVDLSAFPVPDTGNQVTVTVSHLTRRFKDFIAVDNIDFDVRRGEIFGFLGPNGAGKSTTIRMLCGLLKPSSGTGTVAGFDIRTQAELIKHNIGYMSQKFSLYEDLRVEENIEFYGGIYGLSGVRLERRKSWALEMAGLAEHRSSLTALLSGGWKQRLALACAILHEPPIIFLDEPTSGVDPLSRRRFWELIYAMSDRGVTVFVTTHYLEEAEYCDRLALIYNGSIIAIGSPQQLKTESMRGARILDLRCPDPQSVIEPLSSIPEVLDVSLFGAGLHLVTTANSAVQEQVSGRLREMGLHDVTITPVQPSMEDVFIALIEREDDHQRQNGSGAHHP